MKKPLQVTLRVNEPSVVELTVEDRVQLDRLDRARRGIAPRRQGDLLDRGTTRLALTTGAYQFRTLANAHLRVLHGGVTALVSDGEIEAPLPTPLPPDPALSGPAISGPPQPPPGRGDDPDGDAPRLFIE